MGRRQSQALNRGRTCCRYALATLLSLAAGWMGSQVAVRRVTAPVAEAARPAHGPQPASLAEALTRDLENSLSMQP